MNQRTAWKADRRNYNVDGSFGENHHVIWIKKSKRESEKRDEKEKF